MAEVIASGQYSHPTPWLIGARTETVEALSRSWCSFRTSSAFGYRLAVTLASGFT